MANTYKLISSTTLTSTQTAINITSIPQTYTDLVVQGYIGQTSGGNTYAQFAFRINNNSTGSPYYTNWFRSEGSTLTAGGNGTDAVYFPIVSTGGGDANAMGAFEMYFPQYTGAANKIGRLLGGGSPANNASTNYYGMYYTSTSAITQINFIYSGGPETGFVTGTNIRLYGVLAGN